MCLVLTAFPPFLLTRWVGGWVVAVRFCGYVVLARRRSYIQIYVSRYLVVATR